MPLTLLTSGTPAMGAKAIHRNGNLVAQAPAAAAHFTARRFDSFLPRLFNGRSMFENVR